MTKTFADRQFCSWCGGDLKDVSSLQKQCRRCQISDFNNPKTGTFAVIRNEKDEVLCATRACAPGIGKFDMPGGFIDASESAEAAIIRELKEELNLDIKQPDLQFIFTYHNLYDYDGITSDVLDICFTIKIPSSTALKPADDLATAKWVPVNELDYKNFWSPLMVKRLRQYFKA